MAIEEIVSGIEKAIGLEAQARDFYKSRGEQSESEIINESFKFLAVQEQGHFDALSRLKSTLQQTSEWPEKIESEEQVAPTIEQFIKEQKGHFEKMKSNEEISILLWAMRAERRAEQLYLELAKKSGNAEGEKFFNILAKFELGHYIFLDSIIETLTDSSDYLEN